MATTTATIFFGSPDMSNEGVIPQYLIRFIENDRPGLILHHLQSPTRRVIVVPTVENTVDDIYLMIAVLILKEVKPPREIYNQKRESLYDIFTTEERQSLYDESKKVFERLSTKVVFNILEGSHLLSQLDIIKTYPRNFEVTLPAFKKEYSAWDNKIFKTGF